MGGGAVLLGLYFLFPGLGQKGHSYCILFLGLVAFVFESLRLKYRPLNHVVLLVGKPHMRDTEKYDYTALPFYLWGIGLSFFLFREHIAVLAVLFLSFSDPVASYFGLKYGSIKLYVNKSLEGSIAGFTACYLITLAYGVLFHGPSPALLVFALFAAMFGAMSELLSMYIDDNFTIPLISGVGMTLLNRVLHLF
jgi:dolichol kinase